VTGRGARGRAARAGVGPLAGIRILAGAGLIAAWAVAAHPARATGTAGGDSPVRDEGAVIRIAVAPVPGAPGLAERLADEAERHLGSARFLAGRVTVRRLPEPLDPTALAGLPPADVVSLAGGADFLLGGRPLPGGGMAPFLIHLYALDSGYQSRQAAGRAPVVPPGHALPTFARDDPLKTLYALQGIVYVRQGRYAAAFQVLSALNDFPDLAPEARRPVVFFVALAQMSLGLAAREPQAVDDALYHLGALAAAPGVGDNPALLGATLFNRGLGYQLHPGRTDTGALDLAVASYEAALPFFPRDAVPALHARLLYQIGTAEERYPPAADGRHLVKAIDAYGRALALWTPKANPEAYRAALHGSAACYQRLPTGDREDHLRRAIALYTRALSVPGLEARPDLKAATFGNLGQAWQSLAPDPAGDHLRRALSAYREALRYWTAERNPGQHRRLHQLAGQAWQAIPVGGKRDNLVQALDHFDRALAAVPREDDPAGWAVLMFKRGVVLASMPPPGERRALARGREAFAAALEVLTPDKFPNLHAKVVQNLERVEARLAALGGEFAP
jgi:tetratricopeptide (TPR) repeat protein